MTRRYSLFGCGSAFYEIGLWRFLQLHWQGGMPGIMTPVPEGTLQGALDNMLRSAVKEHVRMRHVPVAWGAHR